MERKVYFPIALMNQKMKYPRSFRCKTCGSEAAYIQINESRIEKNRFYYTSSSTYCADHIEKVSKKRNIPILNTWDEFDQWIKTIDEEHEKALAEHKKRIQENEEKTLKEFGRILRLSGVEGRMFELADKTLVCTTDSRNETVPCCWNSGVHLIKHNPSKLWNFPKHSSDCPNNIN